MRKAKSADVMLGTGALVGGLALFGFVLVRSLLTSAASTSTAMADVSLLPPVDESDRAVPFELPAEYLRRAVDAAPFQPDREAPLDRYRLPGEEVFLDVPIEMPAREIPPAPAFQVLGTASSPEGSLAVIQIEPGTPQLLAIGDLMSGYRVESIDRGRVVMTNDDRSLSLAVASPTSSPPSAQQGRGNGRQNQPAGRGGAGGNANQEAARRQMTEAAAGIGARMQNATPEQRAALLQEFQTLQQRLGQQGNAVMTVDGNRVTVQQRDGAVTAERVIIQQGGSAGGNAGPRYEFSFPAQPR
ncbi:MAG TPA: hypothetical protein VMN39_03015 [Longimicrobiaceae bacterium]|nr:hypothetical protein [Longimicrobiaceae bacterium]